MTIKLGRQNTANVDDIARIAANDLVLDWAYFITVTAGIADKSAATEEIAWVNYTQGVYASDNETVAKEEIRIDPTFRKNTYEVAIGGVGTVTKADESNYFDLLTTAWDTVDAATTSATTGQLQLVRFISATKWEFRIVNK